MKNSPSNSSIVISLIMFPLLFASLHSIGTKDHFLLTLSHTLLLATLSYIFIIVSQEQRKQSSPLETSSKQKRITMIASLFTWVQIVSTNVIDSLIYNERINWIRIITIASFVAIILITISYVYSKSTFNNKE